MKRSLEDSGESSGGTKRPAYEPEGGELDTDAVKSYQNFRLISDLKLKRRQLQEAQEELETLRSKSREMETMVGVVQRAWSQLELDASILLDSMGDDAVNVDSEKSELLLKFLGAGESFKLIDATNLADILDATVNKWDMFTTDSEIETHSSSAIQNINPATTNTNTNTPARGKKQTVMEENIALKFLRETGADGEADDSFSANLREKTSFTFSLLERLCSIVMMRDSSYGGHGDSSDLLSSSMCPAPDEFEKDITGTDRAAVNEMGIDEELNCSLSTPSGVPTPGATPLVRASSTTSNMSQACGNENSLISVLTDAKTLHAEKLLMRDRITALSIQLVEMASQLRKSENQRMRAEKEIDKLLSFKEVASGTAKDGTFRVDISSELVKDDHIGGGNVGASSGCASSQLDEVVFLKKQVDLLSKQLSESELAKGKVQMVLTEKVGKPLPQAEAQIADLRRSIDQLRIQHKSRVSALVAENNANQQKRANAEATLVQLEGIYKTKISEVVAATEHTVKALQSDKEAIQNELVAAKSGANMVPSLKKQVQGLLDMEHRFRVEGLKLKDTISNLNEVVDKKEEMIVGYRNREVLLEKQLASGETDSAKVDLLKQAHAKISELEGIVSANKGKLNDLICEIESVASAEEKEREESGKLLRQMNEFQATHASVFEENLRLREEVRVLKQKMVEFQNKLDASNGIVAVRQEAMTQLRDVEATLREENRLMNSSIVELKGSIVEKDLKLEEITQDLSAEKSEAEVTNTRNSDLLCRCNKLSDELQLERKARMDAEMKLIKEPKKHVESVSSTGTNSVDKDMLDMTLNMLRCFVCRDRFKSVVITKCYHMFCSECIDANLKTRNRKCPACGEKFGQDDVKTVYFTH